MPNEPLIFTPELMAEARARPQATRPLIHRWALFPGEGRERARAQLEQAAQLVPMEKRRRALGPLYSDDDKQVFAAAAVLLLAKVLTDQGWTVEHEPSIGGVTPDLRIKKGTAEFVVEVRHVAGEFGLPTAYQRLEASLKGIRSRYPVTFLSMEVDGGASLKRFKAFLRRTLDEGRPERHVYTEPGISISFEMHTPIDVEIPVFTGMVGGAFGFDDRPNVRAALDEKLKKYPFPVIIALQGIETGDLFTAAEEVLFGSEVVQVPVDVVTGGPAGPPRPARARDSALHRRGADGDRVRDRLQALLPFEVIVTDRGFGVRARLLANPAKPDLPGLDRFRPIPCLMHVAPGQMGYLDAEGNLTLRDKVSDLFVP